MSLKGTTFRERRLKTIEKVTSKPSLTARNNAEDSKSVSKDFSNSSIQRVKIPVLHVKNLDSINDPISSSRRKLAGLVSTRTIRKIDLSMYTASNKSLKTSRARNAESFTFPPKIRIKFPISAVQALEYLKDYLSEAETSEVMEFPEVFFYPLAPKKVSVDSGSPNGGYDNEKGDYKVIIGDHLAFRYEILSFLGRGSFGQVCKCFDHKNKELVALKIIRNKKRFHKQGLVEAKLLHHMKESDPLDMNNIVRIKSHMFFRNHLCIVFELLSMNLFEFIKLNGFQRISLNLVARFAVQLLIALQYARSLKIIHCDLKPENILLKNPQKSGIKVIDFGSGCYENERIYTYIQSRFYRAPEIMLGIPYTCSIDMWSFACILVEIHVGFPLFPGENEQEQFARIMEVIGVPPLGVLEESSRKKAFFDSQNKPRMVPNSRGKIRYPSSRPLHEILQTDDPFFLDFIRQILCWEPELRPTPTDALNHPWLVKMFHRQPSPIKKRRVIKSFAEQ
jgi:dual specificity tyrosine-phosphorylation-regulated kinase 2/3/4